MDNEKKTLLACLAVFCSIFCVRNVHAGALDWVVYDPNQPNNDDVRISTYLDKNTLYRRGEGSAYNDLVFNNYNGGSLRLENFGTGGCGAIEDRRDAVYTFELIGDNIITIPEDYGSWGTGFDLYDLCFKESQKIIFVGDGQLTVKYESSHFTEEYSEVYHGGDVYYEEKKHYSADEVDEIGKVSSCQSCTCPRCESNSLVDDEKPNKDENKQEENRNNDKSEQDERTKECVSSDKNDDSWMIIAIVMIVSFSITLVLGVVVLCLFLKERKKNLVFAKKDVKKG